MHRVAVLGLVLSLVVGPAAASSVAASGALLATDDASDLLRSVRIVDVVPDNRSALTGVRTIEAGSTLLVRGTTNRRPDRTAIDVDVVEGPDADRFGFAVVETWAYDGVWTARLSVPADATPGTYTLRARADGDTDYQSFEVVTEKRATLTVRPVSRTAVVVDATLPDGGYVELRDGGTVVGVSSYLSPGSHTGVSVPVDTGTSSFTAVAVVGTPDRRLGAYTVDGETVAVALRLPTPTVTATPTATPEPTATPSPSPTPPTRSPTRPSPTRSPTTGASGPGFGVVATTLSLAVGWGFARRRIR
ncbi:DUF7282 domain-containing protein [Haloplanus aerogenes]|uniref:DUF7282 domain-containing protein n=1 Tax=Haloplanus aerogenes TaxID=660522 RepID=A0A3M0DBX3_9EURY|nr:hypothetical protein [Haloplanus aerogenes]AZH26454.1 hypothetical protein DU502_14230 [Haloplanus aerogenes]RMB18080.1 hypothetical protein ATH50_1526 [Haloplanus aerogenes]